MNSEKWAPIPEWEGSYEVSTHGRVRSLDRKNKDRSGRPYMKRDKVLSGTPNSAGYPVVVLTEGDRKSLRLVHTLVLEAFVGPRQKGTEAEHINRDRADNRLENLRWVPRGSARRKDTCKRGHKLTPENSTSYALRRGKRTCLACARARSLARDRGYELTEDDFKRLADQYYEKIMEGDGYEKRRQVTCKRGHKLTPQNCTNYSLRKGWRVCLACARARSLSWSRGDLPDDELTRLADEYYRKIMDGEE